MVSENIKTLIFAGILIPFLIFQITVIIFIVKMRQNKNPLYCSSFFTLFLMVTILDTVAEIDVFTALRLIAVDFLEFLFIDNNGLIAAVFQISSYTLFTQFYIHFGIAINRFYIAFTTTKKVNSNFNFSKFGKRLIWILPFLTIPFILPRFWFNAYTVKDVNGVLLPAYNVPSTYLVFIALYSTSTCVFSAVMSFILQVLTILQYRNLLKMQSVQAKNVQQEIRLLVQAMIVLLAQFGMAFQQSGVLYSFLEKNSTLNQWFYGTYIYFQTALNFTGPISLMIVGKKIRKDYFKFMFGKSEPSNVPIIFKNNNP